MVECREELYLYLFYLNLTILCIWNVVHFANTGYSIQVGKKQPVYSQKPKSLYYIVIHEWGKMLEN